MHEADLLARLAARYRACGRFAHGYVSWKLRLDPVHRELLRHARARPFGRVLDVGCGHGQIGLLLLEAGLAETVTGLDRNERHLRNARTAANGLAFVGHVHDLSRDEHLPETDTVLVVDVLYQLDAPSQQRLLRAATRAAGRAVYVRTLDPRRGLRSLVTQGLERAGRRVSPNAGAHVNAPPVGVVADTLNAAGFEVEVAPCWQGTPFANVLITAVRAG